MKKLVIGFQVTDFDKWVKHLTASRVSFVGNVVIDGDSGKKLIIVKDLDGNRTQFFEK